MGSSFHSSYQKQRAGEIGEEKNEKDHCLRSEKYEKDHCLKSEKSKFMAGVRRCFLCNLMPRHFNPKTGHASEVLFWIA